MIRIPLALAAAASLLAAPAGALAQTTTAQPTTAQPTTAQPNAAGPGSAGASATQNPAQPAPISTAPGVIPAPPAGTSAVPSAGTQNPQGTTGVPAAVPVGSNIGGTALPPPPIPAVVPPVPRLDQISAPISASPNGTLVGVKQPFVGITLQNAVTMALSHNPQLAVSQGDLRIANFRIIAARGAYDVNFQLVPSYSHSVEPVLSPFSTNAAGGPVTTDTAGATAALRGLTTQGGQYSLGVTASRTTTDNAYDSYNPFYDTALQFAVTQPLGKGRAIDQPRLQLRLAQLNAQVAQGTTLLQASNTVVQVEDAYYDLVNAWQNLAIQEEGLNEATAQAASNRRLAARGAVAPTDIVEANTQVNVFQDNVFAAIETVERVQNELKSLILANPADPVWLANLVPTTPIAQIPTEPSLATLMNEAIRNRPEIAQLRAERSEANENLSFAKDQLKPQIDLGLGVTENGFAGNPLSLLANPFFGLLGGVLPPAELAEISPPPGYQTGGIGQSFANALAGRFPTYSAQLTFSIPIGEHTAKADLAIADTQEQQASINESALLERIRSEAVNAIQGLREAQYRVVAARAAREAAERVLLGEQRRFQAGTSTTFLILQRQLEVATDRGRELQAQTDLDKAIVELQRVSGGIYAQNGIDVTAAGTAALTAAPATSVLPSPAPSP